MGAVPGLESLPEKLLSQCGIVTAVLVVAIIWLTIQLAKANAGREADRTNMIKLFNEQVASYEKLAVSGAKVEGLLIALRQSGMGNDD